MTISDSIRKAINDWEQHEIESAMLHACNAIDGTAAKIYPTQGNNARFTELLRKNYNILGPMGAPGIDLIKTRFPLILPHAKASHGKPDIADVIYGIHRCSHGHGAELPNGFELLEDVAGPAQITRMEIEKGKVRLSDRIIFGLIAVAVFCPVNKDLATPKLDGYFLVIGNSPKLIINDWWGKAEKFTSEILPNNLTPLVTLDFHNMMTQQQ